VLNAQLIPLSLPLAKLLSKKLINSKLVLFFTTSTILCPDYSLKLRHQSLLPLAGPARPGPGGQLFEGHLQFWSALSLICTRWYVRARAMLVTLAWRDRCTGSSAYFRFLTTQRSPEANTQQIEFAVRIREISRASFRMERTRAET
jgi:hypothetical protein